MTAPLIVVIDDDDVFRDLMESALADEGYRTLLFPSSEDAAASIARAQPALVILDLRMERSYDGLAVVASVRANPEIATLPIILCSADIIYLREHRQELQDRGVETLAKPFNLDTLYGCIASLVEDEKK